MFYFNSERRFPYSFGKILNMDCTFLLSCPGVLYQFPRITCRVPGVGNQMAAIFHHITVGPHDGYSFRHSLHTRRIKGAVKAFRCRGWSVKRMIGQQQSQRHLRVALLCCLWQFWDAPSLAFSCWYSPIVSRQIALTCLSSVWTAWKVKAQ